MPNPHRSKPYLVTRVGLLLICTGALFSGCATGNEKQYVNRAMAPEDFAFAAKTAEWDSPPVFLKGKAPTLPYAALQHSNFPRHGIVELAYTITAEGRVQDIRILSATHPQYAAGVIHNLKHWRFKPATKDGHPVTAEVRQTFTLDPYPKRAPVV
ncbi:TonB family protein [Actomonas aquatica]|uniref:TonB family protein n=1 Tax=Actomonas aquatica TaxID=2866162 RepID=A0ABZ1C9I3_9BACT|nr:TonB family protein [Opitutus sp. WL0086]WRQ88300.1 TonB family protein [Opitutus sp. WL0086]